MIATVEKVALDQQGCEMNDSGATRVSFAVHHAQLLIQQRRHENRLILYAFTGLFLLALFLLALFGLGLVASGKDAQARIECLEQEGQIIPAGSDVAWVCAPATQASQNNQKEINE